MQCTIVHKRAATTREWCLRKLDSWEVWSPSLNRFRTGPSYDGVIHVDVDDHLRVDTVDFVFEVFVHHSPFDFESRGEFAGILA